MISYVLPTHNRPQRLLQTMRELARLGPHDDVCGGEIIIIDNASDAPVHVEPRLANGLSVRVVRVERNLGAAARNLGAEAATGDWIVMLDDDSFPIDVGHVAVIQEAPDDVAAIGAEIFLPDGTHEAGGLPEVFIGCGVAIRRQAFLEVAGYDARFDYYAEEYDLCAKLMLSGWRVVHDRRFRVRHEKIAEGRDMNRILHRLVRNNGWVAQRYAPELQRVSELHEVIGRYARISIKERASPGFARGMNELIQTLDRQRRHPMSQAMCDRFTGLTQARESLDNEPLLNHRSKVAIIEEGKNCWAVRRALREAGTTVVVHEKDADVLVIGTLSPGPLLDALARHRERAQPVFAAWDFEPNLSEPERCRHEETVPANPR